MTLLSRSPTAISDEGRHARERGDPASANPYPADSEAHGIWARGYGMPDAEAGPTPSATSGAPPRPDSAS